MNILEGLARFSKTGIDYKATGATKIGTTDNGPYRFHPLFAIVVVSAANTLTIAGALSLGQNSANYDDIIAITTMTGLTALNKMLKTDIAAAIGNIAPNTDLYVKLTTGAIATSASFDIHLYGFYQ